MKKLSTYLDLMACCSRRTFARELAHLGCCPSKQVSPSYPAYLLLKFPYIHNELKIKTKDQNVSEVTFVSKVSKPTHTDWTRK